MVSVLHSTSIDLVTCTIQCGCVPLLLTPMYMYATLRHVTNKLHSHFFWKFLVKRCSLSASVCMFFGKSCHSDLQQPSSLRSGCCKGTSDWTSVLPQWHPFHRLLLGYFGLDEFYPPRERPSKQNNICN